MKAVVVGASSGLGRCIAAGLAQRDAQVALLARREERLKHAAAEAGERAFPVLCDVTDEASSRKAIEESADRLGGIDALIYATGIGPLVRLRDASVQLWRQVFDTNVIGAALVTAAAVPYLSESSGVAVYLSSVSASLTAPWPGLGAYITSKAALEKLVEAWRAEHPEIGFTRITVGDCAGGEGESMTGFADSWDPDLAAEVGQAWVARNLLTGALLEVEELVRAVHLVASAGATASIPTMVVTPRPPRP